MLNKSIVNTRQAWLMWLDTLVIVAPWGLDGASCTYETYPQPEKSRPDWVTGQIRDRIIAAHKNYELYNDSGRRR